MFLALYTPNHSENKHFILHCRALSECQEKAQLLTGLQMPRSVLTVLINGTLEPVEYVGVLNLSPYDACLEKVVLNWSTENPGQPMRGVSVCTDVDVANYCEKVVALYLFKVDVSESKEVLIVP